MKLWSTTPVSTLKRSTRLVLIAIAFLLAVAVPLQYLSTQSVSADQFDEKIAEQERKIANFTREAKALRKKSDSLKNVLAQISNDKAKIQAEVDLYQMQYDQLVKEIKDIKQQIADNRRISGELIVKSSLTDDVPLIVRLASSENLADYIDGEATRQSVRDAIVAKTEQNEKLKKELEAKQAKVKKVLDEQKLKRDELASKEAIQQQLIRDTNNSEASYQKLIRSSKEKIAGLKKAQEELRNRQYSVGEYISVGGSGGYPWSGYGYPCWSGGCIDPWGLYYLECTSYVAWRLSSQGYGVRHFNGMGNAYEWPGTTSGYTSQSSTPRKGDAAVLPAYTGGAAWTGHVMYVEEVRSDGYIVISEYNWNGRGTYSQRLLSPGDYAPMTFITFPRR